jgi:hypothetical protein
MVSAIWAVLLFNVLVHSIEINGRETQRHRYWFTKGRRSCVVGEGL